MVGTRYPISKARKKLTEEEKWLCRDGSPPKAGHCLVMAYLIQTGSNVGTVKLPSLIAIFISFR